MFKSISAFFQNLSFIDYVFFFTVVFLIVLIVSLVYFIRINDDELQKEELLDDPDNLRNIANSIEQNKKPIEFTSYEKEQEDRAIISYDELVKNKENVKINYVDEDILSDISIKKFDLDNLVSPSDEDSQIYNRVPLLSLNKEEEFLIALKELQQKLN